MGYTPHLIIVIVILLHLRMCVLRHSAATSGQKCYEYSWRCVCGFPKHNLHIQLLFAVNWSICYKSNLQCMIIRATQLGTIKTHRVGWPIYRQRTVLEWGEWMASTHVLDIVGNVSVRVHSYSWKLLKTPASVSRNNITMFFCIN